MPKLINLTGQKFGRLTIIKQAGKNKRRQSRWLCRCDCQRMTIVLGHSLKSDNTRSCGCLNIEQLTKHGHSTRNKISPTYQSWLDMNQRCNNPNTKQYKDYGGRGITICKRWTKFSNFFKDMGKRPTKHTLDRMDNDKNYYKKNCRWATRKEQSKNRRNNRFETHDGKTQCLADWAEEVKIPASIIGWRLDHGWSIEMSLTTPIRKRKK